MSDHVYPAFSSFANSGRQLTLLSVHIGPGSIQHPPAGRWSRSLAVAASSTLQTQTLQPLDWVQEYSQKYLPASEAKRQGSFFYTLSIMDFDLASRLEKLQANFGIELGPCEPSDIDHYRNTVTRDAGAVSEDEDSVGGALLAESSTGQPKMKTDDQTSDQMTTESFSESEDEGTLLDCGEFRVGQPTNQDVDFCSWDVILTYPSLFIGKANKPRVRRSHPRFNEYSH